MRNNAATVFLRTFSCEAFAIRLILIAFLDRSASIQEDAYAAANTNAREVRAHSRTMTHTFRFDRFRHLPRLLGRALILGYRLTLSPLIGSDCRHLPTCSAYGDEAIARFGLWAGGWMTLARLCRCHPFGTRGLDFVPQTLPPAARWYTPWRYGDWRRANAVPPEDPALGDTSDASDQRAPSASGSSRRTASADPRSAAR